MKNIQCVANRNWAAQALCTLVLSTTAAAPIAHGSVPRHPERKILDLTFTDYLRSLAPDGEPPDAETFDTLLGRLRGALVHEMKKRGLYQAPPSYLGVYGGVGQQGPLFAHQCGHGGGHDGGAGD